MDITQEKLKSLQVQINRNLANTFKKICIDKQLTQKQQIEEWISSEIEQYKQGKGEVQNGYF